MGSPAPEQTTEREAAKKAKLENVNLRVTILGASVALLITIAGFLGIKLNNTNEEKAQAQSVAQTLQIVLSTQENALTQNEAALQSASSQIAVLSADKGNLEAENSSLSSQLAAAGTQPGQTAATTAAPAAAAPGTIYHQGTVSLAEGGDSINLLAPPSDPKWDAKPANTVEQDYVSLAGGTLGIWYVAGAKVPGGSAADFATCSSLTTYTGGNSITIKITSLSDVPTICLRLSNGRYGTLRLVGQEGETVTLEITVWNS